MSFCSEDCTAKRWIHELVHEHVEWLKREIIPQNEFEQMPVMPDFRQLDFPQKVGRHALMELDVIFQVILLSIFPSSQLEI